MFIIVSFIRLSVFIFISPLHVQSIVQKVKFLYEHLYRYYEQIHSYLPNYSFAR